MVKLLLAHGAQASITSTLRTHPTTGQPLTPLDLIASDTVKAELTTVRRNTSALGSV